MIVQYILEVAHVHPTEGWIDASAYQRNINVETEVFADEDVRTLLIEHAQSITIPDPVDFSPNLKYRISTSQTVVQYEDGTWQDPPQ